jgi:beta-fructofuranosidase
MLHFQPKHGGVWDVVPFYHDGTYHAFFLISGLKRPAWGHAVSKDLFHWEELPVAMKASPTGRDRDGCITGSVIFARGTYWMFYTGQRFVKADRGLPRDQHRQTQPTTICLATSKDAIRWQKHPGNPILVRDTARYAWGDWRDPYVFWHEGEKRYWMTITCRLHDQPDCFGGCLALAKSDDLIHWDLGDPVYFPGSMYPPECSEVFRMGKYWYLVYGYETTRYCIGPSPAGPWCQPNHDTLVPQYGGKSLTDGRTRYFLGNVSAPNPARSPRRNALGFPRELVQGKDGTLYTKLPAVYEKHVAAALPVDLRTAEPMAGEWSRSASRLTAAPGTFARALLPGRHPDFYLEATLQATPGTRLAGVYFNDGDYFRNIIPYQVTLDFRRGDLVFSHKYRGASEERIRFIWADLRAGREVKLQLIVAEGIVEIFVDDKYSIGTQAFDDFEPARIGFFVENGGLTVRNVRIMALGELSSMKPGQSQRKGNV